MSDEELRKAFTELQVKTVETGHRVKVAHGQIQALKVAIKHSELTEQEITQFPDGTDTYQAIGRIFLLTPVREIVEELKESREENEKKIKGIEVNIAHWERSLKDNETSLRELVSQRRDK